MFPKLPGPQFTSLNDNITSEEITSYLISYGVKSRHALMGI